MGPRQYGVELDDSVWETFGSKQSCEIRHEIPEYGLARFAYSNKDVLTLRLETHTAIKLGSTAGKLFQQSPPWKHVEPNESRYNIALRSGYLPMELTGELASWVLESLKAGYQVRLDYNESSRMQKAVQVVLSPLYFQRPYKDYSNCIENLDPPQFTVAEAGFGDISFKVNKATLDPTSKAALDKLARYLADHPEIKQIEITGHTDSKGRGRYNMRLSNRRAAAAALYLTNKKVSKGRIKQQHVGESQPKSKNSSSRGRALNRRTELRFIY
jgi:outer membrane protein OmpA-like peptidoglycan-associated protein